MGKLLVDLDREALERVRVKLGARSFAEALRKLVEAADPTALPNLRSAYDRSAEFEPYRKAGAAALEAMAPRVVRVTPAEGPAFVPIRMPKPAPGSRLKKR